MFDWFADGFYWLLEQFAYYLIVLLDALGDIIIVVVEYLWENFWQPGYKGLFDGFASNSQGISEWVARILLNFMGVVFELAESIGLEFDPEDLETAGDALFDVYRDANWLIPLDGMFAAFAAAYIAMLYVRGARFLIGWLPGVDG